MVIKPYGYAIWEKMHDYLDKKFKETGHQNAYFPIFIPKSYFSKEAHHVDGFAKECAVVTHYRLKNAEDGSGIVVDPDAKLEEELIVRPTSETIIWDTYRLVDTIVPRPADTGEPVGQCRALGNAYAPVLAYDRIPVARGAYGTCQKEEAIAEARKMLDVYADFAENVMAVPVIKGAQDAYRTFRRSGGYLLYRSYDAGRQGPPGRYFTLFGTEFRQSVRCEIFGQGQQHELRMGYFMGGIDPPYGCAYNDAFGRQRAGTASCPGADRSCHGAYL